MAHSATEAAMNEAQRYMFVSRLIEEQPDDADEHAVLRWIGRATAIAKEIDLASAAELAAISSFNHMAGTTTSVQKANAVLYRLLAQAEMAAPMSDQGAFIAADSALDAMSAIGRVLVQATQRVRIVDPYLDSKALTDFAILANEGIEIELLTDEKSVKPTFEPALARFRQQYGSKRPAHARLAAPKSLHDRLIVVDEKTVYTVTQSLNALADRSPASIVRVDGESARLKIDAYDQFWASAKAV
ncbi:phosphatidylserine/phosphatidylglycerophosphate/cardiolipin synthase family protein [Rhizobium ruizarguesonis]|nr:phosphatidylserine/phosphatidylglycerophosphate/cardiolipin synthase family protein [Rhizobium ruizarguesonis]TBC45035.1 phosphatidylserine/phosphatidylglycerophosphate/cardiolipin synthase family protein [Rhizobium ruizarguesonis]